MTTVPREQETRSGNARLRTDGVGRQQLDGTRGRIGYIVGQLQSYRARMWKSSHRPGISIAIPDQLSDLWGKHITVTDRREWREE